MGKYIVCGEAHKEGHVVQANCFETIIDRLDNNSEFPDLSKTQYALVVRKGVSQSVNMLVMLVSSAPWRRRWRHLRRHHLHLFGTDFLSVIDITNQHCPH